MRRDFNQLISELYDVLIIGGGIQGATLSYELARSGIKTALIEKNDFCHATSSNSLKIIHGGIRYLQHLDIKRMRESIRARRDYLHFAPDLVKPLPCLMPTTGYGMKGRPMVAIGLWANDLIGYDRNRGLPPSISIPNSRLIPKSDLHRLFPDLNEKDSNGAACWYDGLVLDTERLALEFIKAAVDQGASVANYMQAESLLTDGHRIGGVKVKDDISGEKGEIRSKMAVNAAGPWIENLLTTSNIQQSSQIRWAKGINIVFKKPMSRTHAIGLEGNRPYKDTDALINRRGGRLFFLVPWRGYTMAGTAYTPHFGNPDEFKVGAEEILELVSDINAICPRLDLSLSDLTNYHAGLVPVQHGDTTGSSDIQLEKHSQVIDHERTDRIKGLMTIKSVKYTTAGQIAKQVKKKIAQNRLFSQRSFEKKSIEKFDTGLSRESSDMCVEGSRSEVAGSTEASIGERTDLRNLSGVENESEKASYQKQTLSTNQIRFYIREEMAFHLSDIVFRRSGLGSAECPELKTLQDIATVMAHELSWSLVNQKNEVQQVIDHYAPIRI